MIHISNSKGRDATVNTKSVTISHRLRWIDEKEHSAETKKVLKSTLDKDIDVLVEKAGGLDSVAEMLVNDDPEIDMELYGSFLKNASRAYIGSHRNIVHRIIQWEILKNPDGTERERRPRKIEMQNVVGELPIKWTGKMIKKEKVYNRFVFSGKMQLTHINGLTYDFLYAMAKELEEKDSLMPIGVGPKSNQPLVFRRGGTPYRGFLEGRTNGDKYALILHLSNLELKIPEQMIEKGEKS
ncbi:MAG: hypothetical protein H7A23_21290 [Leptospiraceae bacterium]|nr:hypothetical protein [Leptospiraceae bacterium]MCP5497097.1 hypothetical protein [Leptospiraceae bacterium]